MIQEGSKVKYLERDDHPSPPDGLLDGDVGTVLADISEGEKPIIFNIEFPGSPFGYYQVEETYLEEVKNG